MKCEDEAEDGYRMIDDARGQRRRRDMEKKKIVSPEHTKRKDKEKRTIDWRACITPVINRAATHTHKRKDPVIQLDRRDRDEISNVPLLALSLLACYFPLPRRVDECF